ncbi:MAG: porin [Elusimicrobia bacterium]|nr:porin [Elusimicrobiota bacterium]
MKKLLFVAALLSSSALLASAAEPGSIQDLQERLAKLEAAAKPENGAPLKVSYVKKKGLTFADDERFKAVLNWRLQMRYSFSHDEDPRTAPQFGQGNDNSFRLRRARIKLEGYVYEPALIYKFEYDWPTATLLDFRFSYEKHKALSVRAGQWKIDFNRERVDSSGSQQFAERSIVNREFTVDRQDGVAIFGRLFDGTLADSRYTAGVFTGNGINAVNDDAEPLYLGRYQWNFLGRDLPFSQSDVEHHEKPAGSLAFAAATNQSRSTRFSSGGGGNLDGFAAGTDGQYAIKQWMEETAFKYRGFSLQHEYHWKQIRNNTGGALRRMRGAYVQAGAFPHYLVAAVPKQLETALRYAFVDPNVAAANDIRQEYTAALNWFIEGHWNKVTLDATHFNLARAGAPTLREERVRLQWDISF